ncbi:hypothetical protein GCM10027174_45910 [Salinifilum aidingensis]
MSKRETWMTVAEFCDELAISRSTFDDWKAKQRIPKHVRLPNGSIRIRRSDFNAWITALEEAA